MKMPRWLRRKEKKLTIKIRSKMVMVKGGKEESSNWIRRMVTMVIKICLQPNSPGQLLLLL